MSNDKMREARNNLVRIEKYLSTQPAEYCGYMDNYFSAELSSIEAALSQQPDSTADAEIADLKRQLALAESHLEAYREVPEGRTDEIVTQLYRRFKDWSRRGFGPDDVTWCEVKADVIELLTAAPSIAEKGHE